MDIYNKSDLTIEKYGNMEPTLSNYKPQVSYFFNKNYINDGDSVLDVGGSTGVFLEAINREVANIYGTVIDLDRKCIALGRKRYPHINFICNSFPYLDFPEKSFDIVSMQGLFPQLPDWKKIFLYLQMYARKYINFSCILKLNGPTIIDKDVSYVYCLETGERVHQIVHNITELINYLSIYEMGIKKINFYGMCNKYINQPHPLDLTRAGHTFRSVPAIDQIDGNFMLELFNPEDNPMRVGGGGSDFTSGKYNFFAPELNIKIDTY